jgi:hypothetical protein
METRNFEIVPREVRSGSIAMRMLGCAAPQRDLSFSIVKPEQRKAMRAASCVFAAETLSGEVQQGVEE